MTPSRAPEGPAAAGLATAGVSSARRGLRARLAARVRDFLAAAFLPLGWDFEDRVSGGGAMCVCRYSVAHRPHQIYLARDQCSWNCRGAREAWMPAQHRGRAPAPSAAFGLRSTAWRGGPCGCRSSAAGAPLRHPRQHHDAQPVSRSAIPGACRASSASSSMRDEARSRGLL
jgi:hypothetical protein